MIELHPPKNAFPISIVYKNHSEKNKNEFKCFFSVACFIVLCI